MEQNSTHSPSQPARFLWNPFSSVSKRNRIKALWSPAPSPLPRATYPSKPSGFFPIRTKMARTFEKIAQKAWETMKYGKMKLDEKSGRALKKKRDCDYNSHLQPLLSLSYNCGGERKKSTRTSLNLQYMHSKKLAVEF